MSLIIALQSAISSLQANQIALEIASNNVANANTEGYSRKILGQEARILDGRGTGVNTTGVVRTVDEHLLKELRTQTSNLGATEARDSYYQRMQSLFGTLLNDSSVAANITDFANTLDALAINPEGMSQRTDVVSAAKTLTEQLGDMGTQLQVLRRQADIEISEAVAVINAQLAIIDELNVNIARSLALNQAAGEMQDQRDIALDKIAELIDITYFTRDNGELVIFTGGGRTILDRDPHFLSHDAVSRMDAVITYADGGVPGILVDGVDITNEIFDGRIAGLIDIRDKRVPNLVAELDRLAATLRDEINAIHNDGTAFPAPNSLAGTHLFTASDTLVAAGTVRIAVIDANGNYVDDTLGNPDFVDIDLSALTTAAGGTLTVQDVIDAINGGVIVGFDGIAGATASLVNGALTVRADNPAYGIVVDGTNIDGSLGSNGSVDASNVTLGGDILAFPAPTVTLATSGISEAAGLALQALLTNGDLALNVETTAGGPGQVRLAADANLAFGAVGGGAGSSLGVAVSTPSGDLAAGGTVEVALDSDGDGLGDTVIGTITFGAVTLAGATAGGSQGSISIQGIDISRNTAVTVSGTTRGFSHFFGLNDFFTTGTNYDVYTSAPQTDGTVPVGVSGTLTVSGAFGGSPATVAYASGDSLTDIAAAITANGTLAAANISASVVTEGSMVRLKIIDNDGNNFTLTDSGTFLSAFTVSIDTSGAVDDIAVRQKIVNDPVLVSHGELDNSAAPSIGASAITAGDISAVQRMARRLTDDITFAAAGGLPPSTTTLAGYGGAILSLNSVEAANVASTLIFKETLLQDLSASVANISAVNIDEELANIVLFQNSYGASARLISVVSEMLETLTEIV
jgi:flagellar hook-associated protein 1 FlgK